MLFGDTGRKPRERQGELESASAIYALYTLDTELSRQCLYRRMPNCLINTVTNTDFGSEDSTS